MAPGSSISLVLPWPSFPLSPPGATQATNRENIQKAISRLDEDLSTLGHMSKLSENLAFPHQVCTCYLSWRRGRGPPTLPEGDPSLVLCLRRRHLSLTCLLRMM